MKCINKVLKLMIVALIPVLLYGCDKDGGWKIWSQFTCTVNNVAYVDNPTWYGLWGNKSPIVTFYDSPDNNLTFSSTIYPKDKANKELPVYIIDCGIRGFNWDMIGKELPFTIPESGNDVFVGKASYFKILDAKYEVLFGNGYMIITSYDEEEKKIYGKIKADVICNNCTDNILHIEGDFRSIIDIN